jgi:hypothetical protein
VAREIRVTLRLGTVDFRQQTGGIRLLGGNNLCPLNICARQFFLRALLFARVHALYETKRLCLDNASDNGGARKNYSQSIALAICRP